jgi:hypothetical protein
MFALKPEAIMVDCGPFQMALYGLANMLAPASMAS